MSSSSVHRPPAPRQGSDTSGVPAANYHVSSSSSPRRRDAGATNNNNNVSMGTMPIVAPKDDLENQVFRRFYEFLERYSPPESESSSVAGRTTQSKYHSDALELIKQERTTLDINFADLINYNRELASIIEAEYGRMDRVLRSVLSAFMQAIDTNANLPEDKPFYVSFYNLNKEKRIRQLTAETLGRLVEIKGTVTRTSEVRPELIRAIFRCLDCDGIQDVVEQQYKYTEPIICKNASCGNRKKWELLMDRSEFIDFQRVRMQEDSSEIPAGSMPRTIDIILRHEKVDKAKPGDKVRFTGHLIVVPDVAAATKSGESREMVRESGGRSGFASEGGATGIKSLGVRELNYRLAFLASNVQLASGTNEWSSFSNAEGEDYLDELDEDERNEIQTMRNTPNLYKRMADSICPTVLGHDEIKRGVLLMLLGGVTKTTNEGIKLRGDINVCIVGDPSTAKSQVLKYVAGFIPRAVYTSGKASSAAGLTASVVKDPETGEFGIEAGALLLADNGICCIDEFDKMESRDQVAIHEAMEQQTISIAKAGIQATLNARTSVLAAANPRDGRYDASKPLRGNIDMTAPIMSRFDLFFVIQDECNEITDYNIARHIVHVHRRQDGAEATVDFTKPMLQRYIRYCRSLQPKLSLESAQQLSQLYTSLRQEDASGGTKSSYRITVRQLESMIRLSEALAKLHCDDTVSPNYIREAHRLLTKSIVRVNEAAYNIADDFYDDGDDNDNGEGNNGATTDAPATEQQGEGGNADVEMGEAPAATAAKTGRSMEIKAEQFHSMKQMLCSELRKREELGQESTKIGELIAWYLQQCDITSEKELRAHRRIARAVIKHLITNDGSVTVVEEEGVVDPDDQRVTTHPNYVDE